MALASLFTFWLCVNCDRFATVVSDSESAAETEICRVKIVFHFVFHFCLRNSVVMFIGIVLMF